MNRKNDYQRLKSAIGKVIDRGDPDELVEKRIQMEAIAASHPDEEVQRLAGQMADWLRRESDGLEKTW